jgi:glycosyltransferase involved in cell wall biosynthesis
MRVAWLAPYPVNQLADQGIAGIRKVMPHPCSWIMNLSQALARTGEVELHIITESPLVARSCSVELSPTLAVHVVRNAVPFTQRGWPPYLPLDMLTRFRAAVLKLQHRVRELAPDLVHAHGTEHSYALAAQGTGLPYGISIQGIIARYYEATPSLRYRVVRHFEHEVVERGRYFFCRTDWDKAFVSGINPTARIFDVPEAMNEAFFAESERSPDTRSLLFVGSSGPIKGLKYLIEATLMARRNIPDLTLRVAGKFSEPLRVEYLKMAGLADDRGWLNFLGFQSSHELAAWHRTSALFVMPSLAENSPNALAEAMVSGMPVIATRVGGVPSMVEDGVDGLLVPPADPESMANAIVRLMSDDAARRRLGAAARKTGERHRPDRVATQTIACYREMIEKKTGREIHECAARGGGSSGA